MLSFYFRRNFGDVEVEIFFEKYEFKDAVSLDDIDLEETKDEENYVAETGEDDSKNNFCEVFSQSGQIGITLILNSWMSLT